MVVFKIKDGDEFLRGFAAALGCIARDHGKPSMALDIMYCNGLSLRDLQRAGVGKFDLKPLEKEIRARKP